jgi:predicted DNA-binding transcriptional regulator AlpA
VVSTTSTSRLICRRDNRRLCQRYIGNDDGFWNIKTVSQKTGLSRASIYRYVARNLFPAGRRIGPGRIAWLGSEVISWMQSRPRPGTPS